MDRQSIGLLSPGVEALDAFSGKKWSAQGEEPFFAVLSVAQLNAFFLSSRRELIAPWEKIFTMHYFTITRALSSNGFGRAWMNVGTHTMDALAFEGWCNGKWLRKNSIASFRFVDRSTRQIALWAGRSLICHTNIYEFSRWNYVSQRQHVLSSHPLPAPGDYHLPCSFSSTFMNRFENE